MDFLNKAYEQVSDFFYSMTPAARLTTGLLLGVIVVSLVFLFRGQATSADAYLFGARPLTNGEISAMTAAFSKASLNDWDDEGNRIRVPRGQRHTYLAALVEGNALPQDAGSAWRDMFDNQNVFASRTTKDLQAKRALEQELAYTIRALSGIENAYVVLSERDTNDFPRGTERRAVVTVKAAGSTSLTPPQIQQIRDTIAYGAAIETHNIVVSDTNAGRSYAAPPEEGSAAAKQNLYAERQRQLRTELKAEIEDRLQMYRGVTVAVRVELDKNLKKETRSLTFDDKPVPTDVTETQIEDRSTSSPADGQPGAAPNGIGNRTVALNGTQTESSHVESIATQKNIPSVTEELKVDSGLTEEVVKVSIGLPRSYFKEVWHQRNPTPAGEDPQEPDAAALTAIESEVTTSIQDAVEPLIPRAPQGEDTFPRIRVLPYDDIPIAAPPAPTFVQTAGSWFAANWQTMAMIGLGFFAIIFLRSMIHSAQTASLEDAQTKQLAIERAAELADVEEDEDDSADVGEFGNSLRGRFQSSGRSLREELTELVRDDPDAAANVLQNWIREAA